MNKILSNIILMASILTMIGYASNFLNMPEPPTGSELVQLRNRTYAMSKGEVYKRMITAIHKSDFYVTGSDSV